MVMAIPWVVEIMINRGTSIAPSVNDPLTKTAPAPRNTNRNTAMNSANAARHKLSEINSPALTLGNMSLCNISVRISFLPFLYPLSF